VKIVPTVPERIGDQILEYIGDLEPGDQFTVNKVGDRFDSSVTDNMVRTYLLTNIGKDEEPEYVVNTTGRRKPPTGFRGTRSARPTRDPHVALRVQRRRRRRDAE